MSAVNHIIVATEIKLNMSASAINGAWMMTVTLLALSSMGLVSGMQTSLTDYENEMMQNGTLVYNSLSTGQKATLFKDFEITYSREVKYV